MVWKVRTGVKALEYLYIDYVTYPSVENQHSRGGEEGEKKEK